MTGSVVRRPIPVAHVITGLLVGGAENALLRLLTTMPREEFPALVISLLAEAPIADRIRAAGPEVVSLGLRRGAAGPGALLRLRAALRRFRPALIQGWMYHGNIAAWAGRAMLPGRVPLIWNVRQSLYDIRREPRGTRAVIRLGARLSGRAEAIIYNSHVARAQHAAIGYADRHARVIPNGFDCGQFRPRPEAGARLRAELGVPAERLIVGLISRFHPMKGHDVFLEAARQVLDAGVDAAFVCAGRDVSLANPRLSEPIGRLGLGSRVYLLGERHDSPELFSGFDVACSASSWGEGFPNAVGEALASATPCVATDVGDTAVVLGTVGHLVPPADPEGLAAALRSLLEVPPERRREIGALGRRRVQEEFSLDQATGRCAECYRELLRGGGPA